MYYTTNRVLSTYSLFLRTLFEMKAPNKHGMDAVRAGLLNMSEQEENVWADYMAHVFWGVLSYSFRHLRNTLSPEEAGARYMDP